MGKLNCGCSKNEEIKESMVKISTRRENGPSSSVRKEKVVRSKHDKEIILIQSFFRGYILRFNNYNKLLTKIQRYRLKPKLDFKVILELEKWNKSFKKNDLILDITNIPEYIESYYIKFFNFSVNTKVISLRIEDFEIPRDITFEESFKLYIVKHVSNTFHIGLNDNSILELKFFEEESSENIDQGLGALSNDFKNRSSCLRSFNDESPKKARKASVKINSVLMDQMNKEEDKENQNERSKIYEEQAYNSLQLEKRNTGMGIQSSFGNPYQVPILQPDINLERDKLPMLFEKYKNKPKNEEIRRLSIEKNNSACLNIPLDIAIKEKAEVQKNSRGGSSRESQRVKSYNKYIPFIKFFLEELERNSKVTEERTFFSEEDGTYYKGSYHTKLEEKFGFGVQYMMNKNKGMCYRYKGYFLRNKFHGYGILQKEDGYAYFGEFREGQQTGFGKEVSDAGIYEGFFLMGKYHGYGIFNYSNKKVIHKGCYEKGFKNNLGQLDFEDGSRYIGNFKYNQMSGNGYFEWAAGHKYYGKWREDKMQGRGKYIWKNLDVYIGQYDNDLRHGEGKYIFHKNNAELKGTWRNGKKEGNFVIKESPTQVYQLQYRNDQQVD